MSHYKVVGTQPIVDNRGRSHAPGDTFNASYSKDQEAFLVGIGAIKKVDKQGSKDADRR